MNLTDKINLLQLLTIQSEYSNKSLLYDLFQCKSLKKWIDKLDVVDLKDNEYKVEQQFIKKINFFIIYFNITFFTFSNVHTRFILEDIMQSNYCEVFVENSYYKNEEFSTKYRKAFNKIIVDTFITNFRYLKENDMNNRLGLIENMITNNKSYEELLNNDYEIERIIKLLRDLLISNVTLDTVVYLFKNIKYHIERRNRKYDLLFYINQWILFFGNYIDKIDMVDKLFPYGESATFLIEPI